MQFPNTSGEWWATFLAAGIAAVPNAIAVMAWIKHYRKKIDDAAVTASAGVSGAQMAVVDTSQLKDRCTLLEGDVKNVKERVLKIEHTQHTTSEGIGRLEALIENLANRQDAVAYRHGDNVAAIRENVAAYGAKLDQLAKTVEQFTTAVLNKKE
jgi:hypothetical protein